MGRGTKDRDAARPSYDRRLVVVVIVSIALIVVVGLWLLITAPTTEVEETHQGAVGYHDGYTVKIPDNAVSLTLRIEIDSGQPLDLYLVNDDQLLLLFEGPYDEGDYYTYHAMVTNSEVVWDLKREDWEDTTFRVIVDNSDLGAVPWSPGDVPYNLRMTTVSRSSVSEHPLLYILFIVIVASLVVCGLEYRRFRRA
jgi:hypothetical protein